MASGSPSRRTGLASRHPAALVALVALVVASACRDPQEDPKSRTEFLLGTNATISIYQQVSDDAFDRAYLRAREIQDLMSINEDEYKETEILRVNRRAGKEPVTVSEDTFTVVEAAKRFGAETDGAFDITIAPIVELWGIGTDREGIPSDEDIAERLQYVDYRRIELDRDERSIFLPESGMGIDVGGIAKGFAVRESARILRDKGVEHAILEFGGDIELIGTRPDGDPWRIGIQHPSGRRQRLLGTVSLSDTSIVSSGPYERYFEKDGERYHHIFSPEDGRPVRNRLTSVTVVGDDSIETDTLSTAAFILGLDRGFSLLEERAGIEGIIATEDGEVFVTGGLRDNFEVTADDFELIDSLPPPH